VDNIPSTSYLKWFLAFFMLRGFVIFEIHVAIERGGQIKPYVHYYKIYSQKVPLVKEENIVRRQNTPAYYKFCHVFFK
jgi:hypothetical protein